MKTMAIILGCVLLLSGVVWPQEVVISDFPLGLAGSVGQDLIKPYYSELKALVDTLNKYPLARAIVSGGADGEQYRENNDAHNPAVALGRAHVLRGVLITEFKVDSSRIIVQSEDVTAKGGRHRYASVRVDRDLSDLETRVDALESRPPVEKHFTEQTIVRETPGGFAKDFGLQFGVGVSSSPYGGIPMVAGAATWKRMIFAEAIAGHTFWNGTFRFRGVDLDTKRRFIGGRVIVYPFTRIPVGLVGGWIRIEEVSQEYYKYVKLSEGPMLGLRVTPLEFLSITGTYNPSKRRVADGIRSSSANGQFLVSIMAHLAVGGAK